MRTALRDDATAYGFSISVTAAYGLASALRGPGSATDTVLFALGAAGAFVLVSICFLGRFRNSPLTSASPRRTGSRARRLRRRPRAQPAE